MQRDLSGRIRRSAVPAVRRAGMSRAHVVAPSELSALRDLELLARTTVEGLRQGLHRSPFHGYSAEFSQYRHYRPGDDLKYVDWKAFARTDRLVLAPVPRDDQSRRAVRARRQPVDGVSRRDRAVEICPGTRDDGGARHAGDRSGRRRGAAGGERRRPAGVQYVPARSGRHHLHLFLAALARLGRRVRCR